MLFSDAIFTRYQTAYFSDAIFHRHKQAIFYRSIFWTPISEPMSDMKVLGKKLFIVTSKVTIGVTV